MENRILTVSSPPHIYGSDTVVRRMRYVIIALIPACIAALYCYGLSAYSTISIAVLSALLAEFLYRRVVGKEGTLNDLSAVVTGLLVAFNLPPDVPFWIPVAGSFFAIIVVKQLFGGLGSNFMNPALAARAFLLASFPTHMSHWTFADATTGATYLATLRDTSDFVPQAADYLSLLFSKAGGCIGETSAVALIIGGLFLIYKKIINWRIPVFYIGSFVLFSFIFGRQGFFNGELLLFEALSGGLMLGAFFMATDYATTPISLGGKIVMGIGCGFLNVMIRHYSGYPEGTSYAILIMNLFVPLIDKYIRPRVYGKGKKLL